MEHEDTWRLWGPHKVEFKCHMASSPCNLESMWSIKVIGWVKRIIHLSICIIGRILKEIQLTWEGKSHFGANETLGLDSLSLWQQWWRCYNNYNTNKIWQLKYEILYMSSINIASNRALMWVGEAQWDPTQIWGRWTARKGRTHGKSWAHTLIRIGLSFWMDW